MEPINLSPVASPVVNGSAASLAANRCINPASDVNARLDTQVEVRVYPCNNSQGNGKKKFTTFNVKPEVRIGIVLFDHQTSRWNLPRIHQRYSLTTNDCRESSFKDRTAVAPATLLTSVLSMRLMLDESFNDMS